MKAVLFLIIFILSPFDSIPREMMKELGYDSTSTIVKGKVLLAKMGFAPVPAFSFNSPIAIGFLSIKKRWFSFEPDFALGLNGKPWMANNWFRFTFFEKKKIKLNTGMNPSLFFKNERDDKGLEVILVQRNLTTELVSVYKISGRASLRASYMKICAFDRGALSGNFLDVGASISALSISDVTKINLCPQLFYVDFEGRINGLFTAAIISVELEKIPLSFYCQAVSPIWTSFDGTKFKWNAGLTCRF